jgi:ABC-type cobalamin/Fe3+-siderophores transport system ATPase subunit
MQKIYVKNFGAIPEAEIEIKKILVLIGPQASGKSTIATLIFFFRGLGNNILRQVLRDRNVLLSDDFMDLIVIRFKELFGLQDIQSSFIITFYYDVERGKYLMIKKTEGNANIEVHFDTTFFDQPFQKSIIKLRNKIKHIPSDLMAGVSKKNEEYNDNSFDFYEFRDQLKRTFFDNFSSRRFIIAGRSASVGFGSLFESFFRTQLEVKILENRNTINPHERLMSEYLESIAYLKDRFQDFATFEEVSNQSYDQFVQYALGKFSAIFKDKYQINSSGEYLELSNGKLIPFYNASSGQQESIRILQDIFDVMAFKETVFRVVEEPEAHLFPEAQKNLVELFALLSNHQPDNQIIITTHSPYILTAFNNLLFANRVVVKNSEAKEEVDKIIPEVFHLKYEDFSAYSLGNSFGEQGKYYKNIGDDESGLINQNYLDTVSEILGAEFQKLYKIHAKSFTRK